MAWLGDLIRFTTTTTGTGTTLAIGSAVPPFMTPATYGAPFNSGTTLVNYSILDPTNATPGAETGTITYNATGPTLTGRTVLTSTTGSAINLSGSAQICFTAIGSSIVNKAGDTMAGTLGLPGTSSVLAALLTNAAEICTVSATAATGTIAFYPSTQSVLYYTTSASANWTTNLAWSAGTSMNTALATGECVTCAFMVTQGATAYYNNVVQVDGTATGVTTIWVGGAPTKGNASGVDVYTYTIVKTGSATYTVFATQTQFKA